MSNKYLDYFYSRGLDDATIKAFNLGYCTESGRCSSPEFQPLTDFRFRDCVLFPIYDLYNNLIAVSSRSITGKAYIHSVYSKRKHLYGLNVTHKEILRTGKVYIVEGNFDLLTLYKNGITNAVAMLGSKLSLEQLGLLTRFADEVILVADGDKAGVDCAQKFVTLAKENSVNHKVISLPLVPKTDPDLFVKTKGAQAFFELQPQNLLDRLKGILA